MRGWEPRRRTTSSPISDRGPSSFSPRVSRRVGWHRKSCRRRSSCRWSSEIHRFWRTGPPQTVAFPQMPKVLQRRGVRDELPIQVNAAKHAKQMEIVESVCADFVSQIEPVGNAMDPQRTFPSHRPPAISGLRAMRFEYGAELAPMASGDPSTPDIALRVARLCFSNPRVVAGVICILALSFVINTLCLTR